MKMKRKWSKPPCLLKHGRKKIYNVYKDGGYDFFYHYIFTTSCDCDDHHMGRFRFDVRNLKSYKAPATGRYQDELLAIQEALIQAIDANELVFPS